jgi:hypothetical protein
MGMSTPFGVLKVSRWSLPPDRFGVAWARILSAALTAGLVACDLNLPHAKTPTISLRLQGAPPEASVTIDDEYVGPLSAVMVRGVALPVGSHRISVEAQGYFPWDKIVEAKSEIVRLDVRLTPIPD